MDYLKIYKEDKMESKKLIKIFCLVVFIIMLGTLGAAVFYNNAFAPSFMLMAALFIFGICYYFKDDRKNFVYVLFSLGVLLIICSLVYTGLRLH